MTSKVRRGCVAALAVAVVCGIPGCSHDTLTSGTAGLAVTYLPSPSGAGRFEQGTIGISGVNFVPADPALAPLAGDDLTLGAGTTENVTSTTPRTLTRVALSPGTYKVTQIDFVPPQSLLDEDPDPNAPNCTQRVGAVPGIGPAASQVPGHYLFDASDGFQFTVRPGQTKLNLRVDMPATLSGFEGAFTCQDDCGNGTPCLTTFDAAQFRAVLLHTVSIE